ncbi:MAG: PaaI family thioesterase [Caldisericaceae bacterium]
MREENYCFVCSKTNPKGIHLEIEYDGETEAKAVFRLGREYEGYPGVVHGGIIAAILDDVMGNIEFRKGYVAFTIELNIKYLKKCLVGEELIAKGKLNSLSHRIIETEGEILDLSGEIRVKASAKYFVKSLGPKEVV